MRPQPASLSWRARRRCRAAGCRRARARWRAAHRGARRRAETPRCTGPSPQAAATTSAATSGDVALERATKWANDYAARLTERAGHRLAELAGHTNGNGSLPRIGGPTTGDPATGFYVGFDVVATSPIQFGGPPPYQPSKVIAAGEQAFVVALIFVNPTVNIPLGWAVPASVQLGGRT
jgi:hypothetical protein